MSEKKIIEVKVPEAGESITEGEVTSWLKKDGEFITEGEIIAEVETDKATIEVNAPSSGILKTKANIDDVVKIGEVIAEIEQTDTPPKTQKIEASSSKPTKIEDKAKDKVEVDASSSKPTKIEDDAEDKVEPKTNNKKEVKNEDKEEEKSYSYKYPSPSAKKMMEEQNISAKDITPTGKGGRISKTDVILRGDVYSSVANYMEKITNQQIVSTIFNDINMTQLINAYEMYEEDFNFKNDVEMTYMGFFLNAIILEIEKHPKLNACIDDGVVNLHQNINISLSFDTEDNHTVMAVLKEVEQMNFSLIEKTIDDLDQKILKGDLAMNDIEGGTISVVSMGDRGSMLSSPPVYMGQVATLALHKIEDRAVSVKGQIVSAPMMYVSLSYDRRAVEDIDAVDFLVGIKSLIENPAGMLIFK